MQIRLSIHQPRLLSQDPLWPNHLEKNHGIKYTFVSYLLKNVLSHVGVHCREWVVKKVEILVGIHRPGRTKSSHRVRSSPGQVYPLLLTSAQVDSFLTDLSGVPTCQLDEISLQSAGLQHLMNGEGILINDAFS